MPKYQKRPVIIDAFQWTGIDCEIPDWFIRKAECHKTEKIENSEYLIIKTLEGDMKASIGDFIIKGVSGELHTCKPDIFHKYYNLVS